MAAMTSPITRNPAVNAPSKSKCSLTAFLGTVGIEPAEYARKLAESAAEYARKLADSASPSGRISLRKLAESAAEYARKLAG